MLRPRKSQPSSSCQEATAPDEGLRSMEAASCEELVRWTMELSCAGWTLAVCSFGWKKSAVGQLISTDLALDLESTCR